MGFSGWSSQGERAGGGAPLEILLDLPSLPLPPAEGEWLHHVCPPELCSAVS